MHYYLYEVKNKVNGKIYVGVHKTNNLTDGYMGSGKVILQAIEKHGLDNFEKTILEFFDDAESMFKRESEVVNGTFLERDDVYNLRRGGMGGFDWINSSNIPKFKGRSHSEETKQILSNLMKGKERPEISKACKKSWDSKNDEERQAFGNKISEKLRGKKKSPEHRAKISEGVRLAQQRELDNVNYSESLEIKRKRMSEARAARKPMTIEEREAHSQRMKEWHQKRRENKQLSIQQDNKSMPD
jgi:hypothetical protein